ncbi:MAG: hypothetical protein R3325_09565 [Thermoanaerobaculia bacterium]|nr:hypothetical protein [Thermoanaerobaculia bacterium]
MGANQASMVRRQRERERQLKRREKQALKAERRAAKKARAEQAVQVDDPEQDPMIDWGAAVREEEVEVILGEDMEVIEVVEEG